MKSVKIKIETKFIGERDGNNFKRKLKQLLEEIIFKLFTEKREIFKKIIEEIIEDIALSKAIEEGRKNEFVSKDEIMDIIENGLKV